MKSNYIHSQNFHIFVKKTHTVNTQKQTQTHTHHKNWIKLNSPQKRNTKNLNSKIIPHFYFLVITVIAYYKHKQGLTQLFKFGLILCFNCVLWTRQTPTSVDNNSLSYWELANCQKLKLPSNLSYSFLKF